MESPYDTLISINCKIMVGESLSPDEERFRQQWAEEHPDGQKKTINWHHIGRIGLFEQRKEAAWQKVRGRLFPENEPKIEQRFHVRWWMAAAAILLLAAAGWYLFRPQETNRTEVGKVTIPVEKNTPPVDSSVYLQLANGSAIALEKGLKGFVAKEGNTTIRMNDTQLVYLPGPESRRTTGLFNTLLVPRGKQFRLVLPDSSRVWLNAGSSLKYPVSFDSLERRVELVGEAYFEIEKHTGKSIPFIVNSRNIRVTVTGTHFNVKAHAGEDAVISLLEGVVDVQVVNEIRRLTPLKQVKVKGNDISTLIMVNEETITAWTRRFFRYQDEDIRTIMYDLARWYKMDIVYSGQMAPLKMTMYDISKDLPLDHVLTALESTGDVKFAIEGRKIIVSQ